jgi:hypothetical protein
MCDNCAIERNNNPVKPYIIINEEIFKNNGGNLNDIANSIKTSNNKLREQSYKDPYFTVGIINRGCTATWLGEDQQWSYILTAAHCVAYKGTETPINEAFRIFI